MLVAGLLIAIVPYVASGQASPLESSSNINCLEKIEMPEYPELPRAAHIEGVQTVKVLLNDQASVQAIETSFQGNSGNTEEHFAQGAEKAVKNSRFLKACGGKTVTLVLHYEFRDAPQKSLFAFAPPNHFWVRAELAYIDHPTQRRKR